MLSKTGVNLHILLLTTQVWEHLGQSTLFSHFWVWKQMSGITHMVKCTVFQWVSDITQWCERYNNNYNDMTQTFSQTFRPLVTIQVEIGIFFFSIFSILNYFLKISYNNGSLWQWSRVMRNIWVISSLGARYYPHLP